MKTLTTLGFTLFTIALVAQAEDWPQFLGPNRNGMSAETGLVKEWPDGGLKVKWRAKSTGGMSGIAVVGDRLLTMEQNGGKQFVVCMNANTGDPIWKTAAAAEYKNGQGNGPRATPTVSKDAVFAFTGDGILAAYGLADGKVRWSHNTLAEFSAKTADYGMACSPLLVDGNVVVTIGAAKATLVAYHAKTGKLVWTAGASEAAGYSSPALLKVGGREQIVALTGASAIGVDPKTGDTLWQYPFKTDFNCNTATPLAIDGNVFISAGENHGAVLLNLKPTGDSYRVSEVWESLGGRSVLRQEWQTSIQIGDYLYGFDNVGSAGPISHFTCINAKTGEQMWQQLRFGKGNLISADGKLFITTMKGELIVVAASPKSYREIGRQQVLGSTRQAPAIAGGLLYVRDGSEVVCLQL